MFSESISSGCTWESILSRFCRARSILPWLLPGSPSISSQNMILTHRFVISLLAPLEMGYARSRPFTAKSSVPSCVLRSAADGKLVRKNYNHFISRLSHDCDQYYIFSCFIFFDAVSRKQPKSLALIYDRLVTQSLQTKYSNTRITPPIRLV